SRAKSFWVELQPDAVLERTDHVACDPEREPRFAAVTGAGRGYEAPLAPKHELMQAGDILIASDEFCAVGQKVVVAIPRWDRMSHGIAAVKVPPRPVHANRRALDEP